eukprot:scaffold1821_cov344-Pavlova_lutheri.AAC.16
MGHDHLSLQRREHFLWSSHAHEEVGSDGSELRLQVPHTLHEEPGSMQVRLEATKRRLGEVSWIEAVASKHFVGLSPLHPLGRPCDGRMIPHPQVVPEPQQHAPRGGHVHRFRPGFVFDSCRRGVLHHHDWLLRSTNPIVLLSPSNKAPFGNERRKGSGSGLAQGMRHLWFGKELERPFMGDTNPS